MTNRPNREQRAAGNADADAEHTQGGSPARLTNDISDMLVRNPAPDGAPSREPVGTYRIISG